MRKIIAFFLTVFILIAVVSLVEAQRSQKLPRIGFLSWGKNGGLNNPISSAFRVKLRELGWIDGENVIIEWRFAKGIEERVPGFIAELIRLKVNAMVIAGGRPVRIAKKATNAIPIIMTEIEYPVETGMIASLARPGANITGLTAFNHQLDGKRIEILKEVIPRLSQVAILLQSGTSYMKRTSKRTQLAAEELGVKLKFLGVQSAADFAHALEAIPRDGTTGFIAVGTQLINSYRKRIVDMAMRRGLPAIFQNREYAIDGGLLSYGASRTAIYAQAATYVDKVLKGAKPADLPVERPKKFDLVVNLKTAKQMGIEVPVKVLRWADDVIQ